MRSLRFLQVSALTLLLTPAFVGVASADSLGNLLNQVQMSAGLPVTPGDEVVGQRSEFSRTFRGDDGLMVTRYSPVPMNVRGGDGRWQAIDTDLKRQSDGDLTPAVTAAGMELPSTLAEPVVVSDGGDRVSLELVGAAGGAPSVKGSEARYANVLAGVDAEYEVLGSGLKETLVLRERTTSRFTYALKLSAGLKAQLGTDGQLEILKGNTVRFVVPAPTVQDADDKGPRVDKAKFVLDGDRVAIAVDEDWLKDAKLPVRVDPTVWAGAQTLCTITSSDEANNTYCQQNWLRVGKDWWFGRTHRAVMNWDQTLATGPTPDQQILSAQLRLKPQAQEFYWGDRKVMVGAIPDPVTPGATWNNQKPGTPWTGSAGGGVAKTDPQPVPRTITPALIDKWVSWDVTRIYEDWTRNTSLKRSLQVKLADEGPLGQIRFGGLWAWDATPYLDVTWRTRQGFSSEQTFEEQQLDDHSRVEVNVANGNPVVIDDEIKAPGTNGAADLQLTRTYQPKEAGLGTIGFWNMEVAGAGFQAFWNKDADSHTALIWGLGGTVYRFDRDYRNDNSTTEAFESPSEFVTVTSSGTKTTAKFSINKQTGDGTLEFIDDQPNNGPKAGTKWVYRDYTDWPGQTPTGGNARLTKVVLPNGGEIKLAYPSQYGVNVASIENTDGKKTLFDWTSDYRLQKVTTHDGKAWNYQVHTSGGRTLLDQVTAPDGKVTKYTYTEGIGGAWERLAKIETADKGTIEFDYTSRPDGTTDQKLVAIRRSSDPYDHGTPWNYNYNPAQNTNPLCPVANGQPQPTRTLVTDSHGLSTSYCLTPQGAVSDSVRNDSSSPQVAFGGTIETIRGKYVKGDSSYSASVSATDPRPGASGVRSLEVQATKSGARGKEPNKCTPESRNSLGGRVTRCPQSQQLATTTYDLTSWDEGQHVLTAVAEDLSRRESKVTINFWIDRTRPAAPDSLQFESEAGASVIDWSPGVDPPIAGDSAPASERSYDEIRWQSSTGVWSEWTRATSPHELTIDVQAVEARSIDRAGNVSDVARATNGADVPGMTIKDKLQCDTACLTEHGTVVLDRGADGSAVAQIIRQSYPAIEIKSTSNVGLYMRLNGQDIGQLRSIPGVASVGYSPPTPIAQAVSSDAALGTTGLATGRRHFGATGTPAAPEPRFAVAIIDSGVDHNHPQFAGRIVRSNNLRRDGCSTAASGQPSECSDNSWDEQGTDEDKHGTHVAGIAAGASGVAPGVDIVDADVCQRVGDSPKVGCTAELGMMWIASLKEEFLDGADDGDPGVNVRVANISIGSGTCLPQDNMGDCGAANLSNLAARLEADGIVVTVSAGNEGPDWGDSFAGNDPAFFAAYPSVNARPGMGPIASMTTAVTVANVIDPRGKIANPTDDEVGFQDNVESQYGWRLAPSSSRGSAQPGAPQKPDLAAPGSAIVSANAGTTGFMRMTGTSMASPFVAGTAALMIGLNPAATPATIRTALIGSAQNRPVDNGSWIWGGNSQWDRGYGHGVIRPILALSEMRPGVPLPQFAYRTQQSGIRTLTSTADVDVFTLTSRRGRVISLAVEDLTHRISRMEIRRFRGASSNGRCTGTFVGNADNGYRRDVPGGSGRYAWDAGRATPKTSLPNTYCFEVRRPVGEAGPTTYSFDLSFTPGS